MTTRRAFIGNEAVVELLRAAIRRDRVSHAYLFTGPPQVGKTTLARWLAKALLCNSRDPETMEPCGVCSTCRRIERDTHPDVQVRGLPEGSRELGIDAIRELTGEIGLLPFEADRRVFVLTDAHAMTIEAANSLLKTLEEPPATALLILAAVDDAALPETIRSRCTVLRLRPVPHAAIEADLASTAGQLDRARRVASLAAGRPGWALETAADDARLDALDARLTSLIEALHGGAQARLKLAEQLAKQWSDEKRGAVYETLFDWLGLWREVLSVAGGGPVGTGYAPFAQAIEGLAIAGVETTAIALEATLQAIARLDANVNTRMAIESMLLELPAWRSA